MSTHPEKHFKETKKLVSKINPKKIANWLLNEGYYPEQYVLPPSFDVQKFKLRKDLYYKPKPTRKGAEFKPALFELITVSFPKSQLTERTFGIIEPTIYHDLTWLLTSEWKAVSDHLFHKDIKIYSYSFPIPVTKQNEANLSELRAGRLIYEFLEMSENDLVAEAHKYKYILKTDIKNFYPTIYTHSIAWALHSKPAARLDRNKFALLGTKLDKLLQNANDGRTNGIPIGSAISDLISEILLAAVDREVSIELKRRNISFLGVRFKDDYRFLCHTKTDANVVIKTLQAKLKEYNLSLNEGKSILKELPEGLFREWVAEYSKISLRYKKVIRYKQFEQTLLSTLLIDQNYPDTGVVDKFLSELTTKGGELKLAIDTKQLYKTFSLLLLLKERRTKSFPQILAIIELLLEKISPKSAVAKSFAASLQEVLDAKLKDPIMNQYDVLWLSYFINANKLSKIKWPRKLPTEFLTSIKYNTQRFYTTRGVKLFSSVAMKHNMPSLVKHLAMFPVEEGS